MESERPGSAAPPLCALRPPSEPAGSVPLPFFLQQDSPVSWDFWASLPAAESPGSWENSLLWDGSSLVFASSSQGQPGMPEGVGALSPQPLLNLSEFPLSEIWDSLSLDASVNAAPDFDPPLGTAAGLDPSAPWLMSGMNPELADLLCSTLGSYPDGLPVISLRGAMWQQHGVNLEQYSQQRGFLNTLDYLTTLDEVRLQGLERGDSCLVKLHTAGSAPRPPSLDPAGFPSPELWLGPPTSATPTTAPDLALPPMAAVCLDPTGVPPTSTTKPALGEIQAHVSRILSCRPKGMSMKQLVKALLKEQGVDLLEISQDGGYRGVVSFLQGVPGIELWNPEKGQKCCAMSSVFKKDVADPLPLLQSTLGSYPHGLRVLRLKKVMWQQHGVNLEEFSQQQGYLNTLDYLTRLRGIMLQGLERKEKCLVKLHTGVTVMAPARPPPPDPAPPSAWPSSSPQPAAPPNPSQPGDKALPGATGEPPGLDEAVAWAGEVLGRFPLGLKVGKLKEVLRRERGLDLEALSRQWGGGDALGLLQALPHLWLQDPGRRDTCLARLNLAAALHPPESPPLLVGQGSASPVPAAPLPPAEPHGMAEPDGMAGMIRDLLALYPFGLHVKNLKKLLKERHGASLEDWRKARGYLNAVSFLRDVPGLELRDPQKNNKCLVQLQRDFPHPHAASCPGGAAANMPLVPDGRESRDAGGRDPEPAAAPERGLDEAVAWAGEVLGRFPLGLKVGKLKKVLRRERGLDLEALSRQWGGGDALGLLQALPHLWLQDPDRGDACLARAAALHPPESPPLLVGQGSAPPVPAAPLPPAEPHGMAKPDGMAGMIRDFLALYPFGLHVKNLKKLLKERHRASLEDWRKARGYVNAVSFLRDVPGLVLRDPQKNNKCLVQLQRDFPHLHAASCPGGAAANMPLVPEGCESRDAGGRDPEPAAAPERGVSEVLMLVMRLLSTYKSGLRLLKIQEFLLERQGLDLEAFVRSQGYEDALGFLQDHLPALEFRRPAKGEKCIVRLETGQAGGSGPLCPTRAFPRPGSKRWLLQTDASKRLPPPASGCLNPRLPSATTNRPLLPCLPSGRAPFRAPTVLGTLGKSPGANPCLPAWVQSPPQPTKAQSGRRVDEGTPECEARPASAPLVQQAEEGTPECGTSTPLVWRAKGAPECGAPQGSAPQCPSTDSRDAPASQPSEDLTELKWKVGQILARHPGGMSLFQFRAAYSAAHQHPLPLGHTASTKQRLAQMPDVVRIQGFGVQALLLPVTPDGPPGGEAGLAPWIPQEDAALVGDAMSEAPPAQADPPPTPAVPVRGRVPYAPAKPGPPLAHFPPAPPAPILARDPDTPAELPPALPAPLPVPAVPELTGDCDIPSELPLVPTTPAPTGDPQFPTRLPPTFMAPQRGPGPKSLQSLEAASPKATPELPSVRPSAPVVLPALGPGSSSWVWQGPGSPLSLDDPDAAARPVIYPPPGDIPLVPTVGPAPPSPPPVTPAPPQPKQVQMVFPFQGHLATRALSLSQTQPMLAAVGSPVDPIPAAPPAGQDLSLATPRSDPRPPPAASGFVTPKQSWLERRVGEALDSPVTPFQRCRPAQPVSAERIKPDPWATIPPPRPPPTRPRRTDTCRLL